MPVDRSMLRFASFDLALPSRSCTRLCLVHAFSVTIDGSLAVIAPDLDAFELSHATFRSRVG